MMNSGMQGRQSWPYLRTPMIAYLVVMGPIGALMVFLIFTSTPAWMKWSSAGVVALSIVSFLRGYVRRLVLTPTDARLFGIFGSIVIPWNDVRSHGVYRPNGVNGTEYVYISRGTEAPAGPWQIDASTIQVQNRPGIPEAVEAHANRRVPS